VEDTPVTAVLQMSGFQKKWLQAAGATLLGAAAPAAMAADYKVGFITSLSGPVSSLGIPYQKGMAAAQAFKGEIDGKKVQVIQLDDASDPSTAARNARKLIDEDKVDEYC
jgi:branched-chain amino acid transport system substrate-binding protein